MVVAVYMLVAEAQTIKNIYFLFRLIFIACMVCQAYYEVTPVKPYSARKQVEEKKMEKIGWKKLENNV